MPGASANNAVYSDSDSVADTERWSYIFQRSHTANRQQQHYHPPISRTLILAFVFSILKQFHFFLFILSVDIVCLQESPLISAFYTLALVHWVEFH